MNFKVLFKSQFKFKSPVLGLLGVILLSLSAPRSAQAYSGKSFLETIGVSSAVGTVLGASTLPFYDQPGSHLVNLAYGAGAGLVVGTGIYLYRWISGQEKRDAFGQLRQDKVRMDESGPNEERAEPGFNFSTSIASDSRLDRVGTSLTSTSRSNRPALVWTPLVSLTW